MGKIQNLAGTKSPIVPYDFQVQNITQGTTDGDLNTVSADFTTYTMPKDGQIVGYVVTLSTAVTAGSLEVDFEIGGSSTLTVETDTASTTDFYGTLEYGDEPFSAGDTLGVTYTADGSMTPTGSMDVSVRLFVMFEDFDV